MNNQDVVNHLKSLTQYKIELSLLMQQAVHNLKDSEITQKLGSYRNAIEDSFMFCLVMQYFSENLLLTLYEEKLFNYFFYSIKFSSLKLHKRAQKLQHLLKQEE